MRAAYWTPTRFNNATATNDIRLTGAEHVDLDDDELLAEARAEAEREGVDLSYGRIKIGTWIE